jgi:23S rRNA (adenine1618-N6)-methyltransferase
MSNRQKTNPMKTAPTTTKKSGKLHPRNLHQGRYDFELLCKACPDLQDFLISNPKGDRSIDFSNPKAVLCLNKALLAHYYQVKFWQIPPGYLCPAVPGRADYVHYAADLLMVNGEIPTGKRVRVLDIGTGANCIYPIIGSQTYGWYFVATDIDTVAINMARSIAQSNPGLKQLVKPLLQQDPEAIFTGVIGPQDRFDLTMCNPPFHGSLQQAEQSNARKVHNLKKSGNNGKSGEKAAPNKPALNFGGQKSELWCEGGEIAFLKKMAEESVDFANQVNWFTSLVSKTENVAPLKKLLDRLGARQIKEVKMSQGQKISRMLAWKF